MTDFERHKELKNGTPVSQNIFYRQLRPLLSLIVYVSQRANAVLLMVTDVVNHIMKFFVTTSFGMVSFSVRSIVTAMSLVLLVPIHIGQDCNKQFLTLLTYSVPSVYVQCPVNFVYFLALESSFLHPIIIGSQPSK